VSEPVREIGSEFGWDPSAVGPGSGRGLLPPRHALFATGCGALTALLDRLAPRGRLHVPSFFCMGVADALSAHVAIAWYRHLPDGRGPHLDTLRAAAGDVVLGQNLFGRDDRAPWDAWIRDRPDVTVVEDHSHDPFGDWARTSTAAYAVASLRKTLPLPDGGLLWSPAGHDLPEPAGDESPGARLKLTAMLLKAAWLDGRPVAKDDFRALQVTGEQLLLGSAGPAGALTTTVLPLLDIARLRDAGTRNARALETALAGGAATWRVLTGGPPGAAPFRVQLLCASEPVRDAMLAHLARHRIYAPVHWRQDRAELWSGDTAAAGCASRILTLPVDHRCGPDDVRRVAEVVRVFAA
jgi:hypothetical protein